GSSGGGGGGGGTISTMSASAPAGPADDMTVATESGWLQTAADTFARNPEAMLAALLHERYGDEAGNTLYASMQPYADAANVLFLANRGNTPDGGTRTSSCRTSKPTSGRCRRQAPVSTTSP